MARLGSQHGQASVEAVAIVPALLLSALVAWQVVLAGQALWLSAGAARAAARAELVGESAERAARRAIPDSFERGLRVERRAEGGVRVELSVPLVMRAWKSPLKVTAAASLGGGG